jgi:thiol:disulfide interchange protein DsbC
MKLSHSGFTMTFRRGVAMTLVTLIGASSSFAADAPSASQMQAALRQNLGPDVNVTSVAATPLDGLYEVNVGKQIIYTDASAKYLLVGQLIESRTRKNLTEAKLQQDEKIDFASLPLSNAIKTVKGNGTRKMAVFADPYCPYCKKLEQTMQKLDNVTIYTFLFPILTPDSKPMSEAIWCSKDASSSWSAWMIGGIKPARASGCKAPALTSNLALAHGMGIDGTPTVVFADGRRRVGALSLDELNTALNAGKS